MRRPTIVDGDIAMDDCGQCTREVFDVQLCDDGNRQSTSAGQRIRFRWGKVWQMAGKGSGVQGHQRLIGR